MPDANIRLPFVFVVLHWWCQVHARSLKVFCDVVGRKSFSRAAAENGISQSAASQVVQQLEGHLGVRLIDRSKRPFVLTAEGDFFYQGCRRLVQRYYMLEDEVQSLHQAVSGRVNVASIYSVGLSYGKRLIEAFTAVYPKATVHIEYHHPNRVYDLVGEGQADLGLVSFARSTRTIEATAWCEEAMILVCAPEHWLASRKEVEISALNGLEIISFDQDLKIRRNIDRQLATRGIEVRSDIAFDNIDTIKRAILVNGGASFLPQPTVASELESGSLVEVHVEGLRMVRPLGVICRRGVKLGRTIRGFVELLEKGVDLLSLQEQWKLKND